jgi:TrmH family RNA methyltransferase
MSPIAPADIRVVLVETSHPGNIGAVARAMKNMGLLQLVLVRPKLFPDPEATARASGADDVLRAARVVASVPEAIAECGLVAATTSRDRDQYFRVRDVREGAARIAEHALRGPVALLFGSERTGLTNDELSLAHLLLRIPANPDYPSLNLAMAVQLVAYETWRARGAAYAAPEPATPLAPADEMERLFAHLQQVMDEVDFRDRTTSGVRLMNRIRRFMHRAELDRNEVNILRGILTAVQQKRRVAGAPDRDAGATPVPDAGPRDA